MHIAAVGWIYVTLMMAITEESLVAGIMTFFFYGVLPTLLILYLADGGRRKRRRARELAQAQAHSLSQARENSDLSTESGSADHSVDTSHHPASALPDQAGHTTGASITTK
jgi:hypothetical protein